MSRIDRPWVRLVGVFALFAVILLTVWVIGSRRYRQSILSSRLEAYAQIISSVRDGDYHSTYKLLPEDIRVTVLGHDGTVIYDSSHEGQHLGNHLERPEIAQCIKTGQGTSIRESETAGITYIYYARLYREVIVRTALPFNTPVRRFMHPDQTLLLGLLLLTAAMLYTVMLLGKRLDSKAAQETSARLQKQKKQMTNNIAHELKTPVTSIRGYLETLVDNPGMDDSTREQFTKRAYSQTLRLSELIRDIGLITKIEEAPEKLIREQLNLREASVEVLEEFSEEISRKGISVINGIPEKCCMEGNKSLIYAIFRNLVENSLRYAGDGITIRLECSAADNGILHLNYSDTGKGVSPEYMDKIFERFWRVKSENAYKAEGSGLGLSIVRNAVAFHGGEIRASEYKPHGIRFEFTLRQTQ